MEEGEGGIVEEEAEPVELDCGLLGCEGDGEGGDEGASVGGWEVGCHRRRRRWRGESNQLVWGGGRLVGRGKGRRR